MSSDIDMEKQDTDIASSTSDNDSDIGTTPPTHPRHHHHGSSRQNTTTRNKNKPKKINDPIPLQVQPQDVPEAPPPGDTSSRGTPSYSTRTKMNYQLVMISELAVIGMLLCSFGIGSAGWSKTESTVMNTTVVIDYQTSIWSNYSCDTHKAPSGTQSASQAFIIMAAILCVVEALLSPIYMIMKKEKHLHMLLIIICTGAYVNSALLVVSVFTVGASGVGSMSTSSILALLAALVNLVAGIMTLVVVTVRHYLMRASALSDYTSLTILGVLGTDLGLVAAVIVLAIIRQPSWVATATRGADAFVVCNYLGDDFGEKNGVFKAVQILMTLAMLLSVITVVLMTVYHKVMAIETRSKIIRGVYITCLLGGIMLLVGLVVFGVQPGTNLSYSFFAALFSAICSLAIGAVGVIRKLPLEN